MIYRIALQNEIIFTNFACLLDMNLDVFIRFANFILFSTLFADGSGKNDSCFLQPIDAILLYLLLLCSIHCVSGYKLVSISLRLCFFRFIFASIRCFSAPTKTLQALLYSCVNTFGYLAHRQVNMLYIASHLTRFHAYSLFNHSSQNSSLFKPIFMLNVF